MTIPLKYKIASGAALALCALLWSTSGFLIKLVDWDPMAIAGSRSLIALVVMLVLVRRPDLKPNKNRILAALFYSATMILFVFANKMTTAANAILLQYTQPVFVILFGRFLLSGEKTGPVDWLCTGGVLGGMVLFFMDGLSAGGNAGNLVAVLSGITFALTAIFMRRQKDGSPVESFILAHILTVVIAIPAILFSGPPAGRGIAGLVLLGVFQMALPSLLYSRGVRGVSALSTALVTMLEPLLNPLWVFLLIGELPQGRAVAGGLVILGCVTVRSVLKIKKI